MACVPPDQYEVFGTCGHDGLNCSPSTSLATCPMATALLDSRSRVPIAFSKKPKFDRYHLPPNAPDLVLGDHNVEMGELVYLLDCSIQRPTAEIGPVCIAARLDVKKDRKSTRLNSSHMSISYAV